MNTFVERPAIQARLLYWLTALHAVNGMLYCTPQQRYLARQRPLLQILDVLRFYGGIGGPGRRVYSHEERP